MKYFTDGEFACKHCGELPVGGMSDVLMERLDALRAMYGKPIHVSSGYRCEYWNRMNGGVSDSQHRKGTAADIWVDGDYETFKDLVLASGLFDSVGVYREQEFCHCDVRNDGDTPNEYYWEG